MAAKHRILLVEDEPGLVITLTDRLESEGYDVASVGDGPSGLERATGERWDVILLDVMLPGASGFDVCRDIRQRGVATPIIMLTARGQVVDRVLGLKLGADDYLTKPFDMLELSARPPGVCGRPRHAESVPVRCRLGGLPQDGGQARRRTDRPAGSGIPPPQVLHRASRSDAQPR
jgi:DNA-binding response OmpR family regulator